MKSQCDLCAYYVYDEECECYMCDINLDEDEYSKYLEFGNNFNCPYFRSGDEYAIARKQ